MPMTEAPRVTLRAIELYERPVTLRMPFRFGVVTLTQANDARIGQLTARINF